MVLKAASVGIGAVQIEDRRAIREFVERNRSYLSGRVLDFGCGKQPYRDCVSGEYHGYDPNYEGVEAPPVGLYDAILITQVLQCPADPVATIRGLRAHLKPGGYWMVTYNASWYEVQREDRWRYSRSGMEALLGGTVIRHDAILSLQLTGWQLHMTYGIVCRNDT